MPARLPVHLAQGFPQAEGTIPNGQRGPVLQPAAFEVEQQFFPGLRTFPIAIPEPNQFFLATWVGPNNDEDAVAGGLQSGLEVHAVNLEIHVAFALEAATLPLYQFLVPALFASANRRGRETRRFWPQEGL